MKSKLINSKFYSIALVFLFLIGIQFSMDAQITVKNSTSCGMFVIVSQYDYTTFAPCDQCPVNPPQFVFINAMSQATIFGQDVCDEQWGWVAWSTNFSNFGITRNPGLGGACGPDAFGPGCGGSLVTTGSWILSSALGTGPAFVNIQ